MLIMLLIFGASAIGVYYGSLRIPFLPSEFYAHASNMGITFSILWFYGFARLCFGTNKRKLFFVSLAAAVLVSLYEWLGWLNTPDFIDGIFGLTGALFAFLTLIAVHQWGLKEKAPRD